MTSHLKHFYQLQVYFYRTAVISNPKKQILSSVRYSSSCDVELEMSSKHLATGDPQPPRVEGKLRLYSMLFCPYAERSRLILNLKNVDHDVINVNLKNKPEWIFQLNPKGLVPVLDDNGKIVTESLDICDYLNQKYPEPPLYNDEKTKEADKRLIDKFGELTPLYYDVVRKRNDKSLEEHIKGIKPYLEFFEEELNRRGTFFGGSQPKMVDFMLWPWAERAELIPAAFKEKIPLNEDDFPRLLGWYNAMLTQRTIKEISINPKRHYEFFKTVVHGGGDPKYDEV